MIIVAGTVPIRPEKRDEAARAATEMAKATQQEEGCLEYHFYSNVEDPDTFLVFERWQSEEALAAHFETTHMAEFRKKLPNLVSGAGEIYKYEVTDSHKL